MPRPISPRRNSIHSKLLATYLILVTLGTSLVSGYVLWSFHVYFTRARAEDLKNWAAALSESAADALAEGNLDRARLLVRRYGAVETVTLRIFDTGGRLIATSSPKTDRQKVNWLEVPGVRSATAGRTDRGIAKGVFSNDDRLYIATPIVRDRRVLGVLRLSLTLEQFQRQFIRIVGIVLLGVGLTILVCAAISDRFARGLSRPIGRMRDFATRVGSGHFGDRLRISHSDELDGLAIELNRMSERLASLDEERRAFLAKVSHELRTPVSNVRVTVEALESGAIDEPEPRERFFQTIKFEIERLSNLIRDLLDLGRLEAGVARLDRQTLSLKGLLDRAVLAIGPRTREKGLAIALEVAELKFSGDPERLLQAVLNILDNAIKHSRADSEITIAGYRSGRSVAIEIRDRGEGIADRDLPRVFEQFYTTDRSRGNGGVGLGLAIAKRIVEAHGGTIEAAGEVDRGATFTIFLPL